MLHQRIFVSDKVFWGKMPRDNSDLDEPLADTESSDEYEEEEDSGEESSTEEEEENEWCA